MGGEERSDGPEWSKFDRDPEALAWARAKVQMKADKYARWEQQATEKGDAEQARGWRRVKNLLRMDFIGGEGCSVAGFDERLPDFITSFERGKS